MIELIPLSKPVVQTIEIPGSKSYTNRALLLAALVSGSVRITNPLFSDDIYAMIDCLESLGIATSIDSNSITVTGSIYDVKKAAYKLNARISGTTIRFITSLCCIVPGKKIITGQEGLNKRPIGELVDGLRQLGAQITYLEKEGFPPLLIESESLTPGTIKLNGDTSSQYFSSIMMIAPLIGDITITVEGNQISKPYIDMTIDTCQEFGVTITNHNYTSYTVAAGQKYHKNAYNVEGDFSSAGYFFAIAALTKSTIALKNLNSNSKQADRRIIDVLKTMGNHITENDHSIAINGTGITPVSIDMEDFPDQAQTLAVLCAFAPGKSTLTGIRSLRIKETERVVALTTELAKMDIKTETTHDSITIYGGTPKPATIDTYGDHRMAMSFAVAGSFLSGIKINNPEVVEKTFPDFWSKLQQIGVITSHE